MRWEAMRASQPWWKVACGNRWRVVSAAAGRVGPTPGLPSLYRADVLSSFYQHHVPRASTRLMN